MREGKTIQIGEAIKDLEGSCISVVPTGYTRLDSMIGGLHKGSVITVASRPCVGKTAFAMDIALNAGLAGIPVLFFSLELSSCQVAKCMVKISLDKAGVYYSQDSPKTMSGDWTSIERVVKDTARIPLYLNDVYNSVDELCDIAGESARKHGIRLIIIDYVQLLAGPEELRAARGKEMDYILHTLKSLAVDLDIPVVILSQLARTAAQRSGHPLLSDLREAQSFEEHSDVILFLHRNEETARTELYLGKNGDDREFHRVCELERRNLYFTEVR